MYLRFYMKRELTQTLGDNSPNFSFASFFPQIARPWVQKVGEGMYTLFRRFNLVPDLAQAQTGTILDKTNEFQRKK